MAGTFKDGEMEAGDKDNYEKPIKRPPIQRNHKPVVIEADESLTDVDLKPGADDKPAKKKTSKKKAKPKKKAKKTAKEPADNDQVEDLEQTMSGALIDRFEAEDTAQDQMLKELIGLVMGHVIELQKPWAAHTDDEKNAYKAAVRNQCAEIAEEALETIATTNLESVTAILHQVLLKDDQVYLKIEPDLEADVDLATAEGGIVRVVIVETDQPEEPDHQWPGLQDE